MGFTLLELLVAMTLLALLTVMLSGGMRFGMRVWERGEAREDQSAGVRDFLRRSVEGMLPEARTVKTPATGLLMTGSATSMQFMTRTLAEAAMGGRYLLQIRGEKAAAGMRLVAVWQRLPLGPSSQDALAPPETRTLLDNLQSVDFAYRGADGDWSRNWMSAAELPRFLRIRVGYRGGDARSWPDLVIQPRITADLSCLYGAKLPICKGVTP
jgi:general secretion pathway protein J